MNPKTSVSSRRLFGRMLIIAPLVALPLSTSNAEPPPSAASQALQSPEPTVAEGVNPDGVAAPNEYDLHYIGFDDFLTEDNGLPRHWTIPYEGKFKKPLDGVAFYEKLGRQDLVESYESKAKLKAGLEIAGLAVAVGGIVYMVAEAASQGHQDCGVASSPNFSACVAQNANQGVSATPFIIGTGTALVGGSLVLAGASIDPNPVDTVEARQLADAYNQGLKAQAETSSIEKPASKAPGVALTLAPIVEPSGAGLGLTLRF